jgi:hypothetical protein
MNFEKDIMGAEKLLIEHYGFLKEEIKNLVKRTPKILLIE